MKSLVLVRHGKSSWENDVKDKERPLKTRGENDSLLVAKALSKHQITIDKILSSTAKRAHSTCKIFCKTVNYNENEVVKMDDLYDFGGENVISIIKALKNNLNTVMIFGHNHAFTSISNIFGSVFIDNLPTSGLVKINFEIDNWNDLGQGITDFIITPKELKE